MTITFQQFHTCDACGCDLEDKDECICQVCKDKNLVAKVKAAILAMLGYVGQLSAAAIEQEALEQVPELTPFNFEPTIKQALDSLMGEGMLERITECGVTTYDLTERY